MTENKMFKVSCNCGEDITQLDDKIIKDQLGDDETTMEKYSPRYRAAEIQIPVLLLHGDTDKTVDVEHSQWMAKELKDAKKDYIYVELPDGDHHLSIQENRTKVFQNIDDFLQQQMTTTIMKE